MDPFFLQAASSENDTFMYFSGAFPFFFFFFFSLLSSSYLSGHGLNDIPARNFCPRRRSGTPSRAMPSPDLAPRNPDHPCPR